MRLPKDPGEWHDAHLKRAVEVRDVAFARYEAKVDLANPTKTDHLFRAYQRADETVDNIMLVLYGRKQV
jgi:hypothetical protein